MLAIFTFKPALGPLFLLSTLAIYCAFKPQNQLGPPFFSLRGFIPVKFDWCPFLKSSYPVFELQAPLVFFFGLRLRFFPPTPHWDPFCTSSIPTFRPQAILRPLVLFSLSWCLSPQIPTGFSSYVCVCACVFPLPNPHWCRFFKSVFPVFSPKSHWDPLFKPLFPIFVWAPLRPLLLNSSAVLAATNP